MYLLMNTFSMNDKSDDELVRNSIIEPRLDRSVRGRGQTRNRRGQRGHERGVVRRVNANSRFRNR